METLTRSQRRLQNRDFRKAATVVFIGMILYMVLNYLTQNILAVAAMLSGEIPMDPAVAASVMETSPNVLGWIACGSVAISGLIMWLFFGTKKLRPLVFPEQTEVQAVFGREKRINVKALLIAICVIYVMQLFSVLMLSWLEELLNQAGMSSAGTQQDYTVTVSLLLYAALIGPFFEELIFRGFVMKGLKQYGKIFAIVTSAICFSLMHGDFQQTFFTFIAGLIFGYIAMEYSIFWSFLLHVFNNFVLGDLWGPFMQMLSESMQNVVFFGSLAVLLVVCIVYFYRNRAGIKGYFAQNKTPKGTYPVVWCSIWLIAFVIVQIITALSTVHPMAP